MSPFFLNYDVVFELIVDLMGGLLNDTGVFGPWDIRPVINLKSNVTITGSGTTTDPYKVEGA